MVEEPLLEPTGDIAAFVDLGTRLQVAASAHEIHNVFDDGGYKEMVLLALFNLRKLDRTGNDAVDTSGRHYEIKTVARVNARGERKRDGDLGVTTGHTLSEEILHRYRSVHRWIVAVFDQARPEVIYELAPAALEKRYFLPWEEKLRRQQAVQVEDSARIHVNNPHIPINFIKRHGTQVWPDGPVQLRLGD